MKPMKTNRLSIQLSWDIHSVRFVWMHIAQCTIHNIPYVNCRACAKRQRNNLLKLRVQAKIRKIPMPIWRLCTMISIIVTGDNLLALKDLRLSQQLSRVPSSVVKSSIPLCNSRYSQKLHFFCELHFPFVPPPPHPSRFPSLVTSLGNVSSSQ